MSAPYTDWPEWAEVDAALEGERLACGPGGVDAAREDLANAAVSFVKKLRTFPALDARPVDPVMPRNPADYAHLLDTMLSLREHLIGWLPRPEGGGKPFDPHSAIAEIDAAMMASPAGEALLARHHAEVDELKCDLDEARASLAAVAEEVMDKHLHPDGTPLHEIVAANTEIAAGVVMALYETRATLERHMATKHCNPPPDGETKETP